MVPTCAVFFVVAVMLQASFTQGAYQYIIQNDCPEQFKFLEQTIVKSNCDVAFPAEGVSYTIPTDGTGDRAAALTTKGECRSVTLFEGGLSGDTLFIDISNIDGYTAGLNVSGYYGDGTVRNIHCCTNCPNTTDSPNCHGAGNYWFPSEVEGYGTAGWPSANLQKLVLQFSCLSQAELHACDGVVCLNDGVCMGGMKGQCLCQPGWGEANCSKKLDYTPCFQVDCGYYGICDTASAEAGGRKCKCLDGYTGELCTVPPANSPCRGVDCGPHGICKGGFCECSAGFTGCSCDIAPNCTIVPNSDIKGNDLTSMQVSGPEECCTKCKQTLRCSAWTLSSGTCYLKASVGSGLVSSNGPTSGYLPNTVTPAQSQSGCTYERGSAASSLVSPLSGLLEGGNVVVA